MGFRSRTLAYSFCYNLEKATFYPLHVTGLVCETNCVCTECVSLLIVLNVQWEENNYLSKPEDAAAIGFRLFAVIDEIQKAVGRQTSTFRARIDVNRNIDVATARIWSNAPRCVHARVTTMDLTQCSEFEFNPKRRYISDWTASHSSRHARSLM